ncbi:unnamed protein product [Chrysoparadoxa australica]
MYEDTSIESESRHRLAAERAEHQRLKREQQREAFRKLLRDRATNAKKEKAKKRWAQLGAWRKRVLLMETAAAFIQKNYKIYRRNLFCKHQLLRLTAAVHLQRWWRRRAEFKREVMTAKHLILLKAAIAIKTCIHQRHRIGQAKKELARLRNEREQLKVKREMKLRARAAMALQRVVRSWLDQRAAVRAQVMAQRVYVLHGHRGVLSRRRKRYS